MKRKASIKALQIFALSFILIAASISASAQEASLRRAERLMNDLNYQKAIEIYSDVLDRVDIPSAKGKLADCYRLTAKYRQAEYWYAQVVRDKDADPDYLLHYAMALQINGKCELAKEWFKNYLNLSIQIWMTLVQQFFKMESFMPPNKMMVELCVEFILGQDNHF